MKEDLLKALKEADSFTFSENGAGAYSTTGNAVLDAFGSLAAMKYSCAEDILNCFYNAFYEDRKLAMRLLFYVRDIRGGQGMRRVFRIIMRSLATREPKIVVDNLDNFLFFGRGDDILCLLDTPIEDEVITFAFKTLRDDLTAVTSGGYPSMLAKWLPSENASSKETKRLAKKFINFAGEHLGEYPKYYRKMLTILRKEIGIVESLMSQNKWDQIKFDKLPAKAAMIYSDAFMKHVQDNYTKYLIDLANGDARVNSASLFPVDIIKKIPECGEVKLKDRYLLDAMWKSLPNYFEGKEETGICMCDTSGSMYGEPLAVSLALGIYCADKCKGPFKNHFITFDYKPKLQSIKGDNIVDKVKSIESINPANTDFEAALNLILQTAINNKLPQEDLPSKLYVISDMQFDQATGERCSWSWIDDDEVNKKFKPFMQVMKDKFALAGYVMPAIVYWNVRASKCGMFQEKVDGEDCCMVSGYSASLFKSVIDGTELEVEEKIVNGEVQKVVKQKIDPVTVMTKTLMNERYDRVVC